MLHFQGRNELQRPGEEESLEICCLWQYLQLNISPNNSLPRDRSSPEAGVVILGFFFNMKSEECAPRHIQMSEELVGLNKAYRVLHWCI